MTTSHPKFHHFPAGTAYEVLSVTPTAPLDVIRMAYRAHVKTAHPDVGGDATRFVDIQRAYEWLTQHREAYDRYVQEVAVDQAGHDAAAPRPTTGAHPQGTPRRASFDDNPRSGTNAWQNGTSGFGTTTGAMFGSAPATGPSWRPHPAPPPPWIPYAPQTGWNGYQPVAPHSRPLNVFAVLSLVLTLSCGAPLALPLALIGLVQIRRKHHNGARMAWTALILSSLQMLIFLWWTFYTEHGGAA